MARSPKGKERLASFPCSYCKHPQDEHVQRQDVSQLSFETCMGCLRENKCLSKYELAVLFRTNKHRWKREANKHLSVCYKWVPMDNFKYIEEAISKKPRRQKWKHRTQ